MIKSVTETCEKPYIREKITHARKKTRRLDFDTTKGNGRREIDRTFP
jgi:hypothetical protein